MTTRQRIESSGLNLNSVLLIVSIIGAIVTTIFFFAPLRTLPTDMAGVQKDVQHMQQTQAVQTEALKILAEVAKDTRDTRREFERHAAESSARLRSHDVDLETIRKRLDRLERIP
jgi:hypothetical protein